MEKNKIAFQPSEAFALQKIQRKQNKPLYKCHIRYFLALASFFVFALFVNYNDIGWGWWTIINFSFVLSILFFVNWISLYVFPFLIQYCHIMFIIIVFWYNYFAFYGTCTTVMAKWLVCRTALAGEFEPNMNAGFQRRARSLHCHFLWCHYWTDWVHHLYRQFGKNG